ncbi:1-acyl-sn-glycerol-3-phosphate acyltransferase [Oceanispirochaeta sp.]|jgi:1-acyl-sn-glycerol-3-phosphate acyltransferase|uniref:lysophospholipid acyltransferase family protein n=1 Tax=Oceanispirochaeta sp. TaxID=2035350 RepID=UPI00262455CB|nr:lysophospholipid acyltransferase family protein [Oceanispirochaeta sp.]MDA3957699.1 lysophospholipid acyltransferase family protein [Oceanispirochaeta sp.]
MYLIGTVLFWIFFGITMVLLFIPASIIWLVTLPFDRNHRVLHFYSCFWGSLYTWCNPFLKVKIEGLEKLKKGQSYVYCPNHQSMMDIVILYRLFRHFKWVAKRVLMRVPFLGWNMWLNGYLSIDRNRPSSQIRMMKKGEALLKRGSSLMIFPEGTRSKDGTLGKFRDGAFVLSQKADVPVVPIAISGSRYVFSDGSIRYYRVYPMTITILDPVNAAEAESAKALGRLVRQKIAENLGLEDQYSEE